MQIALRHSGRGQIRLNGGVAAWTQQKSPTDIVLEVLSDTSIKVSWTDPVEATTDGIKIYANDVLKETVAFGVGTKNITGLTSDTEYVIEVVAYKGSSNSDPISTTATTFITWQSDMLASYVSINSHTTFTYAEKLLIYDRLNEAYVVTTFGPAGLNKAACDFFMFYQNANITTALTTRTITKTGETLRWNYGAGNTYDQNNLPAQINNGVVSVTSIDGFSGITVFDIKVNLWQGEVPNYEYYLPNATTINISGTRTTSGIGLTGVFPIVKHSKIVNLYIEDNNFSGALPDFTGFTSNNILLSIYRNPLLTGNIVSTSADPKIKTIDANECRGITGLKIDNPNRRAYYFRLQGCSIPTADIDYFLNKLATDIDTNGFLFTTLTLNFTGVFNGLLTGGYANADYVKIVNKATAGGQTFTGTFNVGTVFNKGKIVFTADDQFLSLHTLGLPLFASKSIVGTMYVSTNFVGTDHWEYLMGEGAMSWVQLKEMQIAGWDIGSHSADHLNYATISEAEMEAQSDESIADLAANDLGTPVSFAYPNGGYNATATAVNSVRFDSARIVVNYAIFTHLAAESSRYTLPGFFLEASVLDRTPTFEEIKKIIDYANTTKTAIVFGLHCLVPTDDDIVNVYQTSITALTEVIDYCQGADVDVDIITAAQLAVLMGA